ncbi:MAG: RNA pyrophosphohydrolase [Gammaproteobacteria bacterium]|nr:RNA pyrophosphohydrolase [Gammaproteobacteria bacterium]
MKTPAMPGKNNQIIDAEGFRSNVGMVVVNHKAEVLWARRAGYDSWQFPQGGIEPGESPEAAAYRELREEIGLEADDVALLGRTENWLRYRIPPRLVRRSKPTCIGQKQIWFLLHMTGDTRRIRFDRGDKPEFDRWKWVDYWHPVDEVVPFKQSVYRQALTELANHLDRRVQTASR